MYIPPPDANSPEAARSTKQERTSQAEIAAPLGLQVIWSVFADKFCRNDSRRSIFFGGFEVQTFQAAEKQNKSGSFVKYKQAATIKIGVFCVVFFFNVKGFKNPKKKFSKKFHSRVPSKRVAMVSRKVFCGARRPFITGIFHPAAGSANSLAEGSHHPRGTAGRF